MSKIIEIFCEPCDTEKVLYLEDYRKVKKIQEKFQDEWKSGDICLTCARQHEVAFGDYYTEVECLREEQDLLRRGFTNDGSGRWVARGGGVIISKRLMNRIKKMRKCN